MSYNAYKCLKRCLVSMETQIKKLIQILAVAKRGNFSRAAEDLHITQPALSRSIAAFEERLGVQIFDRGRNGATVTPVGRQIVADAEQVLRTVRAFDHNVRLYSGGRVGRMAFGLGPLISSLVMPALGRHFLNERPELLLTTVVRPAQQLCQALMDDHIEMLFCAQGQIDPSAALVIEPVGEIEIGLFVRKRHPLVARQPVSWEELGRYPMLSGAELSSRAGEGRAVGHGGRVSRPGGLILDNYEILQQLCLESDGVWMSSPLLVGDNVARGELCPLTVAEQVRPSRVQVNMIRRTERGLTPAAQAVADVIRAKLTQE